MARPTFNFTARVAGLNELLRLIEPPSNLYGEPWREGMMALARKGEIAAKFAAPVKTGWLKSHIRGVVQRKPMPKWVAIRSRGTNPHRRGYPYPRLLEFSPKHHHQGWFSGVKETIIAQVDAALSQISRGILERWTRG